LLSIKSAEFLLRATLQFINLLFKLQKLKNSREQISVYHLLGLNDKNIASEHEQKNSLQI
jgi:hypothetical protein